LRQLSIAPKWILSVQETPHKDGDWF
jgi:hypothetical protein